MIISIDFSQTYALMMGRSSLLCVLFLKKEKRGIQGNFVSMGIFFIHSNANHLHKRTTLNLEHVSHSRKTNAKIATKMKTKYLKYEWDKICKPYAKNGLHEVSQQQQQQHKK